MMAIASTLVSVLTKLTWYRAYHLADRYTDSLLANDNAQQMAILKKAGSLQYTEFQELSKQELNSGKKQSIETPAWWGVRTLLKVRSRARSCIDSTRVDRGITKCPAWRCLL